MTLKKTLLAAALLGCLSALAVPLSHEQLVDRMQQLAERGDARAHYHLGMFYNNGIGVSKDLHRAYRSFVAAAAAGDPLGAYKVGCFSAGQFPGVVPLDMEQALRQKLRAAEAGYDLAQSDVAQMYLKRSMGGEARPWLERAAAQGHAQALYNLSAGHAKGQWPEADAALSYAYFKLAHLAASGQVNPRAQSSLDEMERSLSPEQLQRAQDLVSAWQPRRSELSIRAKNGLSDAESLAARAD
jgi:TPR repeat protein